MSRDAEERKDKQVSIEPTVGARAEEPKNKRAWVEPEIRVLAVKDTQIFPGVGADGGAYPSSQRS